MNKLNHLTHVDILMQAYQHAEFSPTLNCDERCESQSPSSSAYYRYISKVMDTQEFSVGVIIIRGKHAALQPFMTFMTVEARVVLIILSGIRHHSAVCCPRFKVNKQLM
jgi:hypothetical protein